jgi:XTP/dITP diphosphohydrolase
MAGLEKLVAATRNRAKLEELRRLLAAGGIEVVALDCFDGLEEVEETGATFEENARLKALSYSKQTGLPCVADDSGLEVDALGGAPGVYSSRYAGPGADSAALCAKLLAGMNNVPDGARGARFRCSVALASSGKVLICARGEIRGRIIREMRGSRGFGYDPVFAPEGHDRTFAQMEAHEKDALSHRAKALAAFREDFERLAR